VIGFLADDIDAPARHQSHLSLVGISGFSFQFGRTSTRLPPHLPHLARRWNDGTSTSSPYFDTSINALCRQLLLWQRGSFRFWTLFLIPNSINF
jgi:hypothetical protein